VLVTFIKLIKLRKEREMELFTTEELIIVTRALAMHSTDDRVVNDYSNEDVEALAIKTMNIVVEGS
tara:strand:+ start:274 stop:471 length:198 start_codon:yes stop_codon:yes gene_type:complete